MKIIFAGTPDFAARALEALLDSHQVTTVLTQPDRPAGRGMQLKASPVKQLATQHGLPVLQPVSLKNTEIQQQIAALDADVMVVAAYGLILPKAVLELPRFGCLNIHASLLPRWRGAAPIHRAILAGDKETGITIMQMDEGLDTGDMLLRRVCPITSEDTTATLHDRLARLGAECIVEALQQLQEGTLSPNPQNAAEATYASKLTKQEGRIDWQLPAGEIARAIRAFNPFPGCYSNLGDTTIKIWQALPRFDGQGAPGEILSANRNGIAVACGQDSLSLEILQRPGGKALNAAQFLQSMPLQPGDRFDVC